MRVFISSVRRGLGPERDNLPGLVLALGHEPVAYEGISAQDVPSREACLRAVQSADVVLLVLGTHYGQRMPDTGKSPTEEEWSVAVDAGKPVFVLRKTGVETVDPDQQTFITKLGNYATGRFWTTFTTIEELNSECGGCLSRPPRDPPRCPTNHCIRPPSSRGDPQPVLTRSTQVGPCLRSTSWPSMSPDCPAVCWPHCRPGWWKCCAKPMQRLRPPP